MFGVMLEWLKGLFHPKGTAQVGKENQSVSGATTGDVAGAVAIGNNNVINNYGASPAPLAEMDKFEPNPVEIEILERLECSPNGYLNAVRYDGGFAVVIDGAAVGGPYDDRPGIDVQAHEAVERLRQHGVLSDIQQNGQTYHLSSKGRSVAQTVQMPQGVKAARQAVAKRLRETRA